MGDVYFFLFNCVIESKMSQARTKNKSSKVFNIYDLHVHIQMLQCFRIIYTGFSGSFLLLDLNDKRFAWFKNGF